ncbi:NUDIX hydrolase [Candidatus Woesebacteria bacterium]|nr:NUDIX hydrolase [Candidatus Woesebacteria bacterium]
MINRWDGTIGFIGGKVEQGLNFESNIKKEVKEEIGHDFNLELESIVAHDIGPITTHAFASKVSYETLKHILKDAANSNNIGSEVTGVFTPHLIDYDQKTKKRKGGITELYKASMAPSVREELTHFLLKKKIFTKERLEEITKKAGYSLRELLL